MMFVESNLKTITGVIHTVLEANGAEFDLEARLGRQRKSANGEVLYTYAEVIQDFLAANSVENLRLLFSYDIEVRTCRVAVLLPHDTPSAEMDLFLNKNPRIAAAQESLKKPSTGKAKAAKQGLLEVCFSKRDAGAELEVEILSAKEDIFEQCVLHSNNLYDEVGVSFDTIGGDGVLDNVDNSVSSTHEETNVDVSASGTARQSGATDLYQESSIGEANLAKLRMSLSEFVDGVRYCMTRSNAVSTLPMKKGMRSLMKKNPNDPNLIPLLEETLDEWRAAIATCLREEDERLPLDDTPVAEVVYWRDRSSKLTMLMEQLENPILDDILQILEPTDSEILASFVGQVQEFSKFHVEAKDNTKFLGALFYQLKVLSDPESSMQTVRKLLKNLFSSLSTIWIISRHYNTDVKMLNMLEKIQKQVCLHVRRNISPGIFAQEEFETSLKSLNSATLLLKSFETQYLRTRSIIEETGSEHRWEFDRKKLFGPTKYMLKICDNLKSIVDDLFQFSQFLGPELQSLTGKDGEIESMLQLSEEVLSDFESISFDIYDPATQKEWDKLIVIFTGKINAIESRIAEFIDLSFLELKSSEGAYHLLSKFSKVKCHKNIENKLMSKLSFVIAQFDKEIDVLWGKFTDYKYSPPKLLFLSTTFNAINWAEHLYQKTKGLMVNLRSMEHMYVELPEWNKVMIKYVAFCRDVRSFKDEIVLRWKIDSHNASHYLRLPILQPSLRDENVVKEELMKLDRAEEKKKLNAAKSDKKKLGVKEKKSSRIVGSVSGSKKTMSNTKPKLISSTSNFSSYRSERFTRSYLGESTAKKMQTHIHSYTETLRLSSDEFSVQFHSKLSELTMDTYLFSASGVPMPPITQSILRQAGVNNLYRKTLIQLLKRMNKLLSSVQLHERTLMAEEVEKVKQCIFPGFEVCNWTSLHITTFVNKWDTRLNCFASVLSNIRKASSLVEECLKYISSFNLIDDEFRISKFTFHFQEAVQLIAEIIKAKYEAVKPLFLKIEEELFKTHTGKSQKMTEYYAFYEKKFYNSFISMISRAMNAFSILFGFSRDQLTDKTLIRVLVTVSGSTIATSPTLNEVLKNLTKCLKCLVEVAYLYPRWSIASCVLCLGAVSDKEDKKPIFTFYDDISKNPAIIKHVINLNHKLQENFGGVKLVLDHWQCIFNELRETKEQFLLELCSSDSLGYGTIKACEETLSRLSQIVDDKSQVARDNSTGYLFLDTTPIFSQLRQVAREKQFIIGKQLYAVGKEHYQKIVEDIEAYRCVLSQETNSIDSLKSVLGTVGEIVENSVTKEVEIAMAVEEFRILRKHRLLGEALAKEEPKFSKHSSKNEEVVDIRVESMEIYNDTTQLKQKWLQLYCDARTKKLRLTPTIDNFKATTTDMVSKFVTDVDKFFYSVMRSGPGTKVQDRETLESGAMQLSEAHGQVEELLKRLQEISTAQKLFGLDQTAFPKLQLLLSELKTLDIVYGFFGGLKEYERSMSDTLWAELSVQDLRAGAEALSKKLKKSSKDIRELPVFQAVEKVVIEFQESIPLIEKLKNDALKKRHWDRIGELTGVKFVFDNLFTLGKLFEMQLSRFDSDINEVVNEALQESKIERQLIELKTTWEKTSLPLGVYVKDNIEKGHVLKSCDDLKLELEDHLLNLQTVSGSKFVGSFIETVSKWEKYLNHTLETLDVWLRAQSKWMYLENIYVGAEDIRLQLPQEAKKFDAIDKQFKTIMIATAQSPNVIEACCHDNSDRLEIFKVIIDDLDQSQKSLSDYLNTKRDCFPRFFFISDDELLSVLGTSDPEAIQVHMLKLFDNTKLLTFSKNKRNVIGLESSEGEHIHLVSPANVSGSVEDWMSGVDSQMKVSVKRSAKEGIFYYIQKNRIEWIEDVIGMVAVLGSQTWWTAEVEYAFHQIKIGQGHSMKILAKKLSSDLEELVTVVRQDISSHMRKKINTLLIIDVHARDIVDGLVRDSIIDSRDFAWESQLRFYWRTLCGVDESYQQVSEKGFFDGVTVQQCTGSFEYGYEYMGLNGRLVITGLTDRCYMTITTALTFYLGTAPSGPAGTGKTETVKDLAKGLGISCIVINCGEGLDYKAMGSIFSGLAQIGAWGCFDEFNRINIEVLSVVAAQIESIQEGLKAKNPTCDIGMGSEISLNSKIGIYITMNPGYAGRTELPDNLKALFRPVTMIVPDLLQICEIMLFSEGFNSAKNLAKKMTTLYQLAKGQLSKQFHYDFGLRALKSVLVMAGALKRQYSDMAEDVVLMRALRDSNMPKFVFDDVPLFQGLITDLFPGLKCPRVSFERLKVEIVNFLETELFRGTNQETFDLQVDKTVQMYETMLTRHTCMIVGPTNGGKTVVLDALRDSQRKALDQNVIMYVLNPKAQGLNELYGELDPATRDWTDGVLSNLFRNMNLPRKTHEAKDIRWLIFDGDVDALWIENMNSVMDDNRLLTLPNSERIRLQDYCKLIMETFDLQYASPATISRCGMVYVDPKNLGYKCYFERWLKLRVKGKTFKVSLYEERKKHKPKEPEQEEFEYANDSDSLLEAQNQTLESLFADIFIPIVDFFTDGISFEGVEENEQPSLLVQTDSMTLTRQLCSLLDVQLAAAAKFVLLSVGTEVETAKPSLEKQSSSNLFKNFYMFELDDSIISNIFYYSVFWALGALLDEISRKWLAKQISRLSNGETDEKLHEKYFDCSSFKWVSWSSVVPKYTQPNPFEFNKIFVPTSENVMYTYLLELTNILEKPFMFVGEPGTSKTICVDSFFNAQDMSRFQKVTINFSSRTNSFQVQETIEANVDKRTQNIFGPTLNRKLQIFVDDLNMPRVDTYGTQQPIALLLFMIATGSLYGRQKDLDLKIFRDVIFTAAMNLKVGNSVDPRFLSKFMMVNLTPPEQSTLVHIFNSILTSFVGERFGDLVKDTMPTICGMLLKVYSFLTENFPATPTKFFYVFSLRDLSRTVEGLCQMSPDILVSGEKLQLGRLWLHELKRIFCDRLISIEDLQKVDQKITELIHENFPEQEEPIFEKPLIFGTFKFAVERLSESGEDAQLYQTFSEYAQVSQIFDGVLELYNCEHKPMNLVLFDECLDHLVRIYRVLGLVHGNSLLIGVGGSGKQSLTKLTAFTLGYDIFEISIIRNYGETEFRNDLKEMYRASFTRGTVFLFTDAHVVEESFLEYINNILTTGRIPNLFEPEERDALINQARAYIKKNGITVVDTKENAWEFFLENSRKNLHVVLAMSPSGNLLLKRCRNFPGIISGCTINYFFSWPSNALETVAEHFLQDEGLPKEHNQNIIKHIVLVHDSVISQNERFLTELRRHNYVTPKNFLDFIDNFRGLLRTQYTINKDAVSRISSGLAKLNEAEEAVELMKTELASKKIIVDDKTEKCTVMIEDINKKQLIAQENNEKAKNKSTELLEQNIVIEEEKKNADAQLEEALPLLAAAADALNNLNKNDITEIKGFANPPLQVMQICSCALIFKPLPMDDDEVNWKNCKTMLANNNFLTSLKTYNKDGITDKQVKKVKQYFKDPDFTLENMGKISNAGAGLFQWVDALVKYNGVAKNVLPLKLKVQRLEKEKEEGEQELSTITGILEEIESELSELSTKFNTANEELTQLRLDAQLMEKRLDAANRLILGLGSEKMRWNKDVSRLESSAELLVGDSLLAASFLSYLGVFTADYRKRLLDNIWIPNLQDHEVPMTKNFTIINFLTTDAEIQGFNAHGLPIDNLSVENAVLTIKSSRFPLCVDPQEQAVVWIKNKEKERNLVTKTFGDSDFMKHLELAVQFGGSFLFEDVDEEIDPMVNPILEKNYFVDNGNLMIILGDKTVDWSTEFRLFLTTKLANPHYTPEIMSRLMMVNYSLTQAGLADQLLIQVVGHERKDIEEKFSLVVADVAKNLLELSEIEDLLLKTLASSTGNILDNEELILTLETAKTKSIAINDQIRSSSITKDEIQIARANYFEVAKRGSIMFFAMSGLSVINKMYEISLGLFLTVFIKALDRAPDDSVLEDRLINLTNEVTAQMYAYTCLGIFENHKLAFTLHMAFMIMRDKGELNSSLLDFLLKGRVDMDASSDIKESPVFWLSLLAWLDVAYIDSLSDRLSGIKDSISLNDQEWQSWYNQESPEEIPLPGEWANNLDEFSKLVVYRCLRPDRGYNAAKLFIMNLSDLGPSYVQPPILNYQDLYLQSSKEVPIIFINSPGADPAGDIRKLFSSLKLNSNMFKSVSLGQGQDVVAMSMLENGMVRGHWVLLQNCHLLVSWLKDLESKFVSTDKRKVSDNFRLWLTTDPTNSFPLGILQKSIKVVLEPPDGLKLNLRNTYTKITDAHFSSCSNNVFKPLVYVLSFLHGVLQERRKYGKIGYNVPYDFNFSDFEVSLNLLSLYLEKTLENEDNIIPWKSLKYLIGDAMYGGRVSDAFDRRILITYMEEYFGDFLFDEYNIFYFSKSGFDYIVPKTEKVVGFKDFIETLPLSCGPAVFGLHPNAEINYLTSATKNVYRNLIELQPRNASVDGGRSVEDVVAAAAESYMKKCPESYDIALVRRRIEKVPTPTQVVLLQELERFNLLILKMTSSLSSLQKALLGEVGMTEELDELTLALLNNFLPNSWQRFAPDTQKSLSSWFLHFQQRYEQYNQWIESGYLSVIWLSGLHIPDSYLSALVQTTCREKAWALDRSTLFTEVTKFISEQDITEAELTSSASPCFVKGLYLEGAAWDFENCRLRRQEWKQLVEELPMLKIVPTEVKRLKTKGTFLVPVYVTQNRRNAMGVGLVFEAYLASKKHKSFWVLEGVSLSLNTDE